MRRGWCFAALLLTGCGRYRDFTLPVLPGGDPRAGWRWTEADSPILPRGLLGDWDSGDALNPSVFVNHNRLWNLYSGFDGRTWHTGLAIQSPTGWHKEGRVLSPDPHSWEGGYIAANGSAEVVNGKIEYLYQGGRPPRIGLAVSEDGRSWRKQGAPVIPAGPRGSWDEMGAADPYLFVTAGARYAFYTGMDRASRQRLGVAVTADGIHWDKLRSNPVLELGEFGAFDERGLGEPAVWSARGEYWMLYTGRDRSENRRMGLARSRDGAHWEKQTSVIAGGHPWDSKVVCDPSVLVEGQRIHVWFGGGDVARPDERIHGAIGEGWLDPVN